MNHLLNLRVQTALHSILPQSRLHSGGVETVRLSEPAADGIGHRGFCMGGALLGQLLQGTLKKRVAGNAATQTDDCAKSGDLIRCDEEAAAQGEATFMPA